ncbi:MAG: DNA polymerase III subunit delta [Dehalococcoidia bacterium]|nr:MAG: DNA polymerase III subunit delta [Dehalococcoidia bacterium]
MLYIFHGPDDFIRSEKIAELKAAMGAPAAASLSMTQLDGQGLTLSELRHHTDTLPFFVNKRLVVVNGYLGCLADQPAQLQALLDYLPHLPPTTDLVLVERDTLDKRHPALKLAEVVHFAGLDANNLQPWIVRRAKELGANIEPSAAALLGRLVGPHLRALNSELEKLALYVNDQRPISQADVDLLTPYTEEAEKFGFSNAIGQRDARRAYNQLHKELDEGKNPMAILGGIAAQIRALIEVKDMAERGMSPAEIAQAKGWRSSFAAEARLKDGKNFSMARLEQILDMLLELDLAIKTGRIDSLLALDMLIARLCAAS